MPLILSKNILYATKGKNSPAEMVRGMLISAMSECGHWVSLKLTLSMTNYRITVNVTFVAFAPSFSFGMAYDFIDSVGNDVDVVSDSEVSVWWGGHRSWAVGACSVQESEKLMK